MIEYRTVSSNRNESFDTALNKAAAEGFRFVVVLDSSGDYIHVLMSRELPTYELIV